MACSRLFRGRSSCLTSGSMLSNESFKSAMKPGSDLAGAETDGRVLAVRAWFPWSWNLVDLLIYFIGYL